MHSYRNLTLRWQGYMILIWLGCIRIHSSLLPRSSSTLNSIILSSLFTIVNISPQCGDILFITVLVSLFLLPHFRHTLNPELRQKSNPQWTITFNWHLPVPLKSAGDFPILLSKQNSLQLFCYLSSSPPLAYSEPSLGSSSSIISSSKSICSDLLLAIYAIFFLMVIVHLPVQTSCYSIICMNLH